MTVGFRMADLVRIRLRMGCAWTRHEPLDCSTSCSESRGCNGAPAFIVTPVLSVVAMGVSLIAVPFPGSPRVAMACTVPGSAQQQECMLSDWGVHGFRGYSSCGLITSSRTCLAAGIDEALGVYQSD